MEKKIIYAALLGLGTVGTGVYKVLKGQKEEMEAKIGSEIRIKKIMVRNLEKAASRVDDPSVLTNDWDEILNDPEIDIVIELMGGIEPARTCILAALEAGKHVVSANKDLIAVHGKELLDMAEAHQVDFLFEAAVAGGIPIIRPLKQCLAGNHMREVMGIVNGTTNFILTKMTQDGMEFKEALALATELGYAEADPTADIEGLDAGRKVAILASVAFNSRVVFDDVYIEGITKISAKDIRYAKEMGCDIKLLGVARNTRDGIEAYVCPMLIPSTHPLASVNDSYNAVFVNGDAVENAMFFGRGAGELPTASAVVGDVFDIARNIHADCCARIGCTCYKNIPVKKMTDTHNRYFLRLHVEDRCGVLAEMTAVFAKYHVSGQLRVAPEHVSNQVLKYMGKPSHEVYEKFLKEFDKANKKAGLQQFAVPYFMSSHPGCTMKEAVKLAEYVRDLGFTPEQVQDFYPTPSTLSTCMYYTGIHPLTGEKVYVPKSAHEKAIQRALMQYKNPVNRELVLEGLKIAGRMDLVGYGEKCLIRPVRKEHGDNKYTENAGRNRESKHGPAPKKTIRNHHTRKKQK